MLITLRNASGRCQATVKAQIAPLLVPPMALSRILLGVHYPSDVAFGVALGAAVAGIARKSGRGVAE